MSIENKLFTPIENQETIRKRQSRLTASDMDRKVEDKAYDLKLCPDGKLERYRCPPK